MCLPCSAAEDGNTALPDSKIRVHVVQDAHTAQDIIDLWVTLRGNSVAALYIFLLAFARGNWGNWGRAINRKTATPPANRGGRCGDATRGSKGHGEREEGLVEHHREEWRVGAVILKAEAALRTGGQKGNKLPLINLLPWLQDQ